MEGPLRLSLIFLLFLFSSTVLAGQLKSFLPLQKEFDELVLEQLDEDDLPGLSVSILNKQDDILNRAYGYADLDTERKISSDTLFRIGSLSSLFIVIAIQQLADEGKLNLDKNIKTYLNDFQIKSRSPKPAHIKIRDLLSHHGGLPNTRLKGLWSVGEVEDWRQTLSSLNHMYLSQEPGTIYGYSVFGYELLARVVEVISGLRIEDYVHRKILEPLGMSNTVYRLEGKHHLLIAKEYKDEDVMPHLLPRDTPVNGLYSTSHDLTRLVSMLMAGGVYENRRILSKNAVKEMFTPQNKSVLLDLDREVGFAWNLSGSGLKNVDGIATLTGSALFSASRIGLSLEHQTAVIVLSNSAGSWGAIEKISKEALARVIELKSGTRPEIIEAEKEVPITIAGAEKREFKSDYATFLGWGQITPQGKDLEAELMGWTLRLSPHDSGWYSVHYDLLGVISLDADWITKVRIAPAAIAGRNILLSWHNGQRYYFGLEWKKAAIPEQWTSRVGKYELSNPDIMTDRLNVQEGELQIDGGRVYFYYTIPNMIGSYLSVPITPMDANTAIIPGLGTFMNETISVVNTDKGEALEFSGYLWKKKTKRLDDWF